MGTSTAYDAILFDLGKVLIPFDFQRAYAGMQKLSGVSSEETRDRIAKTDLFVRFESGQVEPADFVQEIGSVTGCELTLESFGAIWNSIFLPEPLLPESLLIHLRKKHRIYIVSNTNITHFEMLREAYPLLSHFDGYVLSYQIKAMKPAQQFYAAALAMAKCTPKRALFIDDLEENVKGAQKAGMDAIQFYSREQLESELSSRGLLTNS